MIKCQKERMALLEVTKETIFAKNRILNISTKNVYQKYQKKYRVMSLHVLRECMQYYLKKLLTKLCKILNCEKYEVWNDNVLKLQKNLFY